MQDWLAAQAAARPDGLALIIGHHRWTYRDLQGQVALFATRLARAGVGPAMRVGLLMPNSNSLEMVLALYALMRLGALPVLLNTRLTACELQALLDAVACDVLLCSPETALVGGELAAAGQTLVCVDDSAGTQLPRLPAGEPAAVDHYLERVLQPADPCAIVPTSGTSGRPRGVMLTWNNIFYSAMGSAYRIGVLPHDRWLCVLPLYHVGGLSILLRACLYGITVELWSQFDAGALAGALEHSPVTLVSLVPTMLYRVLEARAAPLRPQALRLVLLGGAAADPELVTRAHHAGLPVAPTYGLTEAASQVATARPEAALRKPGSVGKPLLFTRVRIVDADDQDVPVGHAGEIVVSGPTVMIGYARELSGQPGAIRNGWLHTGDIGYLDEEGDLWVVQRRSDLIISGGENVYPAEVERVLRMHPAVADAAVVGIDSPEWGQQVAAVLVLRHPAVAVEDILAFSRTHLARYKQPRVVRQVQQIPRSMSGKLRRADLLALFED